MVLIPYSNNPLLLYCWKWAFSHSFLCKLPASSQTLWMKKKISGQFQFGERGPATATKMSTYYVNMTFWWYANIMFFYSNWHRVGPAHCCIWAQSCTIVNQRNMRYTKKAKRPNSIKDNNDMIMITTMTAMSVLCSVLSSSPASWTVACLTYYIAAIYFWIVKQWNR